MEKGIPLVDQWRFIYIENNARIWSFDPMMDLSVRIRYMSYNISNSYLRSYFNLWFEHTWCLCPDPPAIGNDLWWLGRYWSFKVGAQHVQVIEHPFGTIHPGIANHSVDGIGFSTLE